MEIHAMMGGAEGGSEGEGSPGCGAGSGAGGSGAGEGSAGVGSEGIGWGVCGSGCELLMAEWVRVSPEIGRCRPFGCIAQVEKAVPGNRRGAWQRFHHEARKEKGSMKNQTTFNLRIPQNTSRALDVAAGRTGLTRQNVCRLAISLGLSQLKKEGFHIATALQHRAELENPPRAEMLAQRERRVPGVDFPEDG